MTRNSLQPVRFAQPGEYVRSKRTGQRHVVQFVDMEQGGQPLYGIIMGLKDEDGETYMAGAVVGADQFVID